MTIRKYPAILWAAMIASLVGLLVLAGTPASIQAGPDLPIRDTPTPTPAADADKDDDRPAGAYLDLHVAGAPAGAWAVVQWQDSAGGWHDVQGWSGTLDKEGNWRWWVDIKDFGKGPFRWSVSQGHSGLMWGVSQLFWLPAAAGESVQVVVTPQ
jgi:hypothetical protein